jgi:hypothetical protein
MKLSRIWPAADRDPASPPCNRPGVHWPARRAHAGQGRQGQQLRREPIQDGQTVGVHPPAPGAIGEKLRPSSAQMEKMRRGRHGRSLCKVIITPG